MCFYMEWAVNHNYCKPCTFQCHRSRLLNKTLHIHWSVCSWTHLRLTIHVILIVTFVKWWVNESFSDNAASEAYLKNGVSLPIVEKWKEIGCELGVPRDILDSFQTQTIYRYSDVDFCFQKMFSWWRENGRTKSLKVFSKALHSVGYHEQEYYLQKIHGKR